jgi:putative sigma-54 modulation protein
MPIEITARHMKATPEMQDYARGKGEALMREFSRVEHVHVILDVQKHLYSAEIVVQAKNHIHVESLEATENARASIDGAFEKTERQLRKLRDKVQKHRARTPA